jgi:hypothetical protein
MKKVIRLTESDLTNLIKRVISENESPLPAELSSSYKRLIAGWKGENGGDAHIDSRMKTFLEYLDEYSSSKTRNSLFRKCEEKHGKLPSHIRKYYKHIFNLD